MTFKGVGGLWRRVDSQEPNPPTLAEVLNELLTMYTIICTNYREGKIEKHVEGKEVRKECEQLRKIMLNRLVDNYLRIEVVNNETGEIKEYWNNGNNTIQF